MVLPKKRMEEVSGLDIRFYIAMARHHNDPHVVHMTAGFADANEAGQVIRAFREFERARKLPRRSYKIDIIVNGMFPARPDRIYKTP